MTRVPGYEDDIVQEEGLLRAVDSTDVLKSGSDNGSSSCGRRRREEHGGGLGRIRMLGRLVFSG